jgi:hypothetical protein
MLVRMQTENVENDNLAIDEINLIDDVAAAFHAQGKR